MKSERRKAKNNFRGILFDLDGTLIRSMEDHYEAWRRAFDGFGISLKPEDYYPLEGLKLSEVAEAVAHHHGRYDIPHDEIIKKKEEQYLRLVDGKSPEFYPGVLDFIRKLETEQVPRAIVTAGLRERVTKTLPAHFLNMFSSVITGDDCERGKPSPDPYLKGADAFGFLPKQCIAVENAPLGVQSAKRAGMFCIAVASTVERAGLKEADLIVDRFADTPLVIDKMVVYGYTPL